MVIQNVFGDRIFDTLLQDCLRVVGSEMLDR